MSIRHTLQLSAPVEQAFAWADLVADPARIGQWMKGVEETIFDQPVTANDAVGARFVQKIREGGRVNEYQGEITAYNPPHHLGVRLADKHTKLDIDYRFTPAGDGSRIDYRCDLVDPTRFVRVVYFLFRPLTSKLMKSHLKRLQELIDENASAESPG